MKLLAIQGRHCIVSLGIVAELDESESFASARRAVDDHRERVGLAERIEELPKVPLGRLEGEIADYRVSTFFLTAVLRRSPALPWRERRRRAGGHVIPLGRPNFGRSALAKKEKFSAGCVNPITVQQMVLASTRAAGCPTPGASF